MWKTFYKLWSRTKWPRHRSTKQDRSSLSYSTGTVFNFIFQLFFYLTFLANCKPGSTQLLILSTLPKCWVLQEEKTYRVELFAASTDSKFPTPAGHQCFLVILDFLGQLPLLLSTEAMSIPSTFSPNLSFHSSCPRLPVDDLTSYFIKKIKIIR